MILQFHGYFPISKVFHQKLPSCFSLTLAFLMHLLRWQSFQSLHQVIFETYTGTRSIQYAYHSDSVYFIGQVARRDLGDFRVSSSHTGFPQKKNKTQGSCQSVFSWILIQKVEIRN